MRVGALRGTAPRLVALFALISLLAVGLISGSVLMLDKEARRSRAEEAARRDLDLIAVKLKGALNEPQAGPLIAGIVKDVDAYAGVATGRTLDFDPTRRGKAGAAPRSVLTVQHGVVLAGAAVLTPAGQLTVTRAVESNGPLRPALIRYGGFASLLAVLLAAFVGTLVGRALTARVAAMNAVFASAAGGATGVRAASEGPLEFRVLACNLNAMLDALEQRLLALRLSSDRMAHDLRTPLTRLASGLAPVEASADPLARNAAAKARGEIERLVSTLNALLDLREIETESLLVRERFRVDAAVREAIDLYEAEASDVHGVAIVAELSAIEAVGSEPLIVRAVANLLDNALRAAPPGSMVSVATRVTQDGAMIEICDSGPGIPPSLNADLANEESVRSRWNGHGLGLAIVRAIAARHGGSFMLARHEDRTTARLSIAPATSLLGD